MHLFCGCSVVVEGLLFLAAKLKRLILSFVVSIVCLYICVQSVDTRSVVTGRNVLGKVEEMKNIVGPAAEQSSCHLLPSLQSLGRTNRQRSRL